MKEVSHLRDRLLDGVSFIHRTPSGEETLSVLHEVKYSGVHYALMHGHQHGVGEAYLYEVLSDGQLGEIETEVEWEQVIDQIDHHLHTLGERKK
jgi:hypothetical protein